MRRIQVITLRLNPVQQIILIGGNHAPRVRSLRQITIQRHELPGDEAEQILAEARAELAQSCVGSFLAPITSRYPDPTMWPPTAPRNWLTTVDALPPKLRNRRAFTATVRLTAPARPG